MQVEPVLALWHGCDGQWVHVLEELGGDWQLQLRRKLHPWRRGAGEVELAGSGLEWRMDRRR